MRYRVLIAGALSLCFLGGQPSGASQSPTLTDEIGPFRQTIRTQLVVDKDFAGLDRLERELRTSKARFTGGDWKLWHFNEVLSGADIPAFPSADLEWQGRIALLKQWQAAQPQSAAAALLLASAWRRYGWVARGADAADKVSEQQFGVFKDRLNQAGFALNESRRKAADNPQWYAAAINIGIGLEWPRERVESLFAQAMVIEPLYQHAYFAMAYYLLPRWYGAPGDWVRFATQATARVNGDAGAAIFNHIIVHISPVYSARSFIEEHDIEWRQMQSDYDARERLYGPSARALNAMARLAAAVNDKPAARRYMSRIGDAWDPDVWRSRKSFDEFQEWLAAQ